MTPEAFIQKWQASTLTERSAAQSFFIDLCRLLDEPDPASVDPEGISFTFEKGALKSGGGDGWADVWKKGCFAWEFKGKKHPNLDKAYAQLKMYAGALGNPPLLIVSDFESIQIHTNFTYLVDSIEIFQIDDLRDEYKRRRLKCAFADPEQLRPETTREAVTRQAAKRFSELAERLVEERKHDPHRVAHFLNKILFCLFAEDIGILPPRLFTRLLDNSLAGMTIKAPKRFAALTSSLFRSMATGGDYGVDYIDFFNGGLFDSDDTVPLEIPDIRLLRSVANLDWSAIEPSIFGTLFERALDSGKRSQLGAHYTDARSILRIVRPVVVEPLAVDWEKAKAVIQEKLDLAAQSTKGIASRLRGEAVDQYRAFLKSLQSVRILDPACGSGNFLYLALISLKDLEHRIHIEAESWGEGFEKPVHLHIDPENVMGIELNSYAAELARVTIWIGHLQWSIRHSRSFTRDPILKNLDRIENRDAVLAEGGGEAIWRRADFIIGNPPFLGNKKMIKELGEQYTAQLRECYEGRVPGGADLVTYWFEKARAALESGVTKRAGLVATNSIRGGANREVLERIRESGEIFNAYSDEEWVVEGAAVRVSIICFAGKDYNGPRMLDEKPAPRIFADLTASSIDLTQAKRLRENAGVCFQGIKKVGAFDLDGELARQWLTAPRNPNGRPNSEVLRPYYSGMFLTRRPEDRWIVDFGVDLEQSAAALFEKPFQYVLKNVMPVRKTVRRDNHRENWWRFGEARPGMRSALKGKQRFIATPEISKHRIFTWLSTAILNDGTIYAIAREDDTTFGILHSRFHEAWSLRLGTSLEDRPRYTVTTTFETYPFPENFTPNLPAASYADDRHAQAIAGAARRLNELRENWLNPPELVIRVPEIVSGYPDRILPKDAAAADEIKKRTLTNLYNARPAWLDDVHKELNAAVAQAYGWPEEISNDEALERLLALNHARAR